MKEYLGLFFKGMAMGAVSVIPGVSSGTIALLIGVFERLIHSVKSFDLKALKYLFTGRLKDFFEYTDLFFLLSVVFGIGVSIFTIALLLKFMFSIYEPYIWAYFFGLVLSSVYVIGRSVERWTVTSALLFLLGAAIAIFVSFMNPATENDSFLYLLLCGGVAMCGMMVPGLSPSFVLIIMGNYELIAIKAVNSLDFSILSVFLLGAVIGLFAFSYLFSWIFLNYKKLALALLTGFVLGSLNTLWPWKKSIFKMGKLPNGDLTEVLDKNGDPIVQNYQRYLPDTLDKELIIAIGLLILGVITVLVIAKLAEVKPKPEPYDPFKID